MSRQDAYHCCNQCFGPKGISSLFEDMTYSGFLLCLATCSAFLQDTLVGRIQVSKRACTGQHAQGRLPNMGVVLRTWLKTVGCTHAGAIMSEYMGASASGVCVRSLCREKSGSLNLCSCIWWSLFLRKCKCAGVRSAVPGLGMVLW